MQPLEKPPAGVLILHAFAFGPSGQTKMQVGNPLWAGSDGWVLLKWSVANPTPLDYKTSVRLLANETVVAQNDKVLLNGFHLGTTQWHPGEENYELYLLPLKQAGRYHLQVIVYDPSTSQELYPGGLILPEPVIVKAAGE
jgi:hypothetical protein